MSSAPQQINIAALIGPKGINWRGTWSSITLYNPNDAVALTGSSYLALTQTTNVNPATDNGTNWALLAQGSSAPTNALSITKSASLGPIFWLGALEDELSGYVLAGGSAPYPINGFSDGNSWAHLINSFFGQPCVGRWTPMGSSPNPPGTNYSTANATLNGGESTIKNYNVQSAQLITDYGPTLPANSVVIFHLGIQEVYECVVLFGPVWTPSTWKLTSSGGFTIPASGNITINVLDSTGAAAGTTAGFANAVGFEFSGGNFGPFTVVSSATGTITIATNAGFAGIPVPNSTVLKPFGAAYIDGLLANVSGSAGRIVQNLVAALPSTGSLIIISPPDLSLWPDTIATGFASAYHATWQYFRSALSSLMPTSSLNISGWDMNPIFLDVITNYPPTNGTPGKFGFSDVTHNFTAGNPSDFCYAASVGDVPVYVSGAMHNYIAQSFIPFLKARKYLSVY